MTLRRSAFSAGRQTAMSGALRAGLQVLQTMILARLLSPADYGLMAIVASALAVIMLFADMGTSRALIHYDDTPGAVLSSLYWLGLGVAGALTLGLIIVAPLIARGFSSPELTNVLRVSSLAIILAAIGQQHRILAEKRLSFGPLARIEVTAALLGFLLAVLGALLNWGAYALVAGLLTTSATNSLLALLYLSDGERPMRHFKWRETKPYLKFGTYLIGESVANTLHREADVFIGGFLSNPSALGLYSVPRDLSLRVASAVNPVLTRVSFPVMAMAKHDGELLKSIYLQSLRITASINFPIYLALLLLAHEIVALLYGPKWSAAAPFLQLMAVWGLIRSTGSPVGSLLYACGRPALAFWWNLTMLAVTGAVLLAAAHAGGLTGLAWSMVALQVALFVPVWYWLVRPLCGAGFALYFVQFLIPLTTSLIALVVAAGFVSLASSNLMRATIGVASGGVVYLLASYFLNRQFMDALLEALHLSRHKA